MTDSSCRIYEMPLKPSPSDAYPWDKDLLILDDSYPVAYEADPKVLPLLHPKARRSFDRHFGRPKGKPKN